MFAAPRRFIIRAIRFTPRAAGAAFVLHVCHSLGGSYQPTIGVSMLPTIAQDGDYAIVDRTCRHGRRVKVGDIVAAINPVTDVYVVKRVVGMPGDFVVAGRPGKRDRHEREKMMQVRIP